MLAPVLSGNFWLRFPGFQDPKNPFHDKRVRQAVSLAVDRDAINRAQCAGLGEVDGNWINDPGPGNEFATAVAAIILQVPYKYLPILQR